MQQNNMLLKIFKKIKIYLKFFISGSTATAIDLFFLYLLHGILHIPLIYSVFFAYLCGFIVSFLLQKFWTFSANVKNSNNSTKIQFFMYTAISVLNLFLNSFFVYLLVNYHYFILNDYLIELLIIKNNIWYLIVQAFICGVLGIESFIVYNFFIFKKKNKNSIDQKDLFDIYDSNKL